MGSEAAPSVDTGQVPNQLAILVPTFDPSVDNVEIWASKVELLLATWPPQRISELATRLILGCKGTAYQKLQLHRTELLVNEPKGIKKLVELVGGTWGQVPIEKKYEVVEKAVFRNSQKPDETSDSFISRSDVVWTELESKGITLSEIRSYILLRGSRLSSEDKKRVLVESGAEIDGALKLPKVVSAIRMLGSGFFQELTGAKKEKGLKTYDHTAFLVDEGSDHEETFWAHDDTLDDSVLENLASEDDEDAALVLQFEDAVAEVVQNDGELCALYSSYQDARKRLSEKVRFRGFWKVRGSEKGKSKGFKGSKGRGGSKQSLANRIASSYCRICHKKGHWKNECPQLRDRSSQAPSSASSSIPTSFVEVQEPAMTVIHDALIPDVPMAEDSMGRLCETCTAVVGSSITPKNNWSARDKLRGLINKLKITSHVAHTGRIHPASESRSPTESVEEPLLRSNLASQDHSNIHETLFASTGTTGVVDIGASQTVIGDKQVPELLSQLPCEIRKQVRQVNCNLVFRFGNHQTLVSKKALLMPLGKVSFRIAIVPGQTPFLLSNSFLKGIKAVIDTDKETLWSKLLKRSLQISRTAKNLFLMDINQLWTEPSPEESVDSAIGYKPHCFVSEALPKQADQEVHETPDSVIVNKVDQQEPNMDTNMSVNKGKFQPEVPLPAFPEPGVEPKETSNHRASQSPLMSPAPCGSKSPTLDSCDNSCSSNHVIGVSQAHGVSQGSRGSQHCREDRFHQEDGIGRTVQDEGGVRNLQEGDAIPSSLRGPLVDRLVRQDLRVERQAGTREIRDLCREEVGHGDHHESTTPQEELSQAGHAGPQEGRQKLSLSGFVGDAIGVRGRGSVHDGLQPKASGTTHGLHDTGEPAAPSTNDSHGDGHPGTRDSCERSDGENRTAVSCPDASDRFELSGDMDFVYHAADTTDVSYGPRIRKLVQEMLKEYHDVQKSCKHRVHSPQIGLLEVMCHNQSELTHQAEKIGLKAIRFSLDTGDLSTATGRKNLFHKLCVHRPRDVWYSPECKYWCQWSHFNMQKTLDLFEKIMSDRWDNLWQIALGIVLHQIQVGESRHFIWNSLLDPPCWKSLEPRTSLKGLIGVVSTCVKPVTLEILCPKILSGNEW